MFHHRIVHLQAYSKRKDFFWLLCRVVILVAFNFPSSYVDGVCSRWQSWYLCSWLLLLGVIFTHVPLKCSVVIWCCTGLCCCSAGVFPILCFDFSFVKNASKNFTFRINLKKSYTGQNM
jgi:hypothetical protein